jgi:hypothetical protein
MELRDSGNLTRRGKLKEEIERLRHRGLILTADRAQDRAMRVTGEDAIDRAMREGLPHGRWLVGVQRRAN